MVGVALLIALMAGSKTATTAAGTGVMGDWIGPTRSVVRVEPCGANVCVRIVKMPPNPPATEDLHNPDAAQRSRPLCGANIGTGFRLSDPAHLVDGRLYDPTSGKTYKGSITADGDAMKLHGYIGISAFGRTETWHRVPRVEACS